VVEIIQYYAADIGFLVSLREDFPELADVIRDLIQAEIENLREAYEYLEKG
jgi:hypothetical protein